VTPILCLGVKMFSVPSWGGDPCHLEIGQWQRLFPSLPFCPHSGSEKPTLFFFPFPAPLQLHLSSLTEKVWNRLEVGPQNKKLWQAVKPVWNTHTTVGPEGETKSRKSILRNLFLAYLIVRCVYICVEVGGRLLFFWYFLPFKTKDQAVCVINGST